MKKRYLSILLTVCVICNISACKAEEAPPECTHRKVIYDYTEAPTCVHNGYDISFCAECGEEIRDNFVSCTEHNFQYTYAAGDCESGWVIHTECVYCDYEDTTFDNQAGHNYVLTDKGKQNCRYVSQAKYKCSLCGAEYSEDLPQHNIDTDGVCLDCGMLTEYTLTSGYYLIGRDLPSGTATMKVLTGSAVVTGLNDTELKCDTSSNATDYSLAAGDFIHIMGDAISIELKYKRTQPTVFTAPVITTDNAITLQSGTYTIGNEVKESIYDVRLVSGQGRVFCDTMSPTNIDAYFSSEHCNYYSNVELKTNAVLTVSGCTIQLIPKGNSNILS